MTAGICLLALAQSALGDLYVSPTGSDSNPGTLAQPLATVQTAINTVSPGETIYIRGGTYHEEVSVSGLNGTASNPIVITNYQDEKVLFDGSADLSDLGGSDWQVHSGNIYKTTINKDIWQLWVDGRMAIVARWPNYDPSTGHPCDPIKLKEDRLYPIDGSWWDLYGTWGTMANRWNADGILEVDPSYHDLAAENISFEDGTVGSLILNYYSESQFSRPILSHEAGSNTITHRPVVNPHDKGKGWFMVEHRNALDQPGEWYYDMHSGEVWLWCEDGESPQGREVRGKTLSYAFSINGGSYVEIRGLEFFACTVNLRSITHSTIEDCRFSYPTWFRRMLGEHTYNNEPAEARPEPMGEGGTFFASDNRNTGNNTMRNCIWEYSDGLVSMGKGVNNLVENCLFHHWSFTGMASYVLNIQPSKNSLVTRSTFHTNGSKVMIKHNFCDVTWNHAYHFGYFQKDGTAFQCAGGSGPGGGSDGRQRHHNWVHDCLKAPGRWDGNDGYNGWDYYNVTWNVGSYKIKGDYHKVINNTCINTGGWDNQKAMIELRNWNNDEPRNTNSDVYNNLADLISGDANSYVAPHGNLETNWDAFILPVDKTTHSQVRDVFNWDLRPRSGSELIDAGTPYPPLTDNFIGDAPDIGAYEFEDTHYWIPGYQSDKARTPIPLNGSTDALTDTDLMWLEGIDATSHDVYFGTDPSDLAFMGNQENNIYTPAELIPGKTYYWRIDTVTTGETITGEVWSFTPVPRFIPAWVSMEPVMDVGVDSNTPDTNKEGLEKAPIRTSITGGVEQEAYLKFHVDVPGQIKSASLELYHDAPSNISGVQVWSVSDTEWDADSITYNNRPAIDGSLLDSNQIYSKRWRKFDVTEAVTNGWITLALDRAPSDSNRSIPLSESQYSPKLHIEYEAPPENGTAYDWWEYENGILGWGRSSDFDGDGLPNAHEYFFGMDPKSGSNDSAARVSIMTFEGKSYPVLSYTFRHDGSVSNYLLQTSNDMSSWSTRTLSQNPSPEQFVELAPPVQEGNYSRISLRYNTPNSELADNRLFIRVEAVE